MGKLISIIIPVYNTEKYLERCINSVLQQTYQDVEIILIDDGSTDASGEICDLYQRKDSRVKVIHKENAGVTSARRKGLELSRGEYVGFIDSDDWVDPDMYINMYDTINRETIDIVCTGYFEENSGSTFVVYDEVDEGLYQSEDIEKLALSMLELGKGKIQPSLCTKLYRKDIILSAIAKLEDEVTFGEDCLLNFFCFLLCKKVIVKKEAYYHYAMNEASACHSKNTKFLKNVDALYNCALEVIGTNAKYADFKRALDIYTVKQIYIGINDILGMEEAAKIPFHRVPLDLLWKESKRIVLHGAGHVGRAYYLQLKNAQDVDLVLWTDKNYSELQKKGIPVQPLEKISTTEFDYLVLGVKEEGLAKEIAEELISKYGVEKEKICWKYPERLI